MRSITRVHAVECFSMLAAMLATPAAGRAEEWRVTAMTVTLSLPAARLADVGLVGGPARSERVSFVAPRLDLTVLAAGGVLSAPGSLPLSVPVRGELPFGAPLAPLRALTVELDPARGRDFVRLVAADDPELPEPFLVRNGGVLADPARGILAVRRADVLVSGELAEKLGRPRLAGECVGELEIELQARLVRAPAPPAAREPPASGGAVLDVLLGELYGIGTTGHVGEYPNGTVGLSAATTSCNNGTVPVPWNGPMEETHPFIGLAVYREMNGALEMLGRNWIKHGFFALQNDQCGLGCESGGPFTELGVGCSDTYSISANASPYYLGPRTEVNPHTGAWEACGSWFDAVPVDCLRDYFGDVPNAVERRVEVRDADLDLPGATYYYEGIYVVAGDDSVHNNIGWRECTMFWEGRFWDFSTVGANLEATPGPVVAHWADDLDSVQVAPDDGLAFLGARITPAGASWHYEYALYNRTCARGIRSFAVAVYGANLSAVGFRDADQDPANDWTSSIDGGWITWSTDDFAQDPDAPALRYQTLFNFRFDADAPPSASAARMDLFEPGIGATFFLGGPAPGALTGAPAASAVPLALAVRPNPFTRAGSVEFSVDRAGAARLSVLDVTGREVAVLVDGRVPSGPNEVEWNGRDAGGRRLAAGVYFFRLEQDGRARTQKGVLLR